MPWQDELWRSCQTLSRTKSGVGPEKRDVLRFCRRVGVNASLRSIGRSVSEIVTTYNVPVPFPLLRRSRLSGSR